MIHIQKVEEPEFMIEFKKKILKKHMIAKNLLHTEIG